MKNLAIIPARGGSKRIPHKNIKKFLGKPIISYSIETALKTSLFDEVMVSTDDDEIAEIAVKYGANVPFIRSKENSNDYAGLSDVVCEVLKGYMLNKESFDNVCCILATAPFLTQEILNDTYHILVKKQFDAVFPVVKYPFPIQRAMQFDGDLIKMILPQNRLKRSQDLNASFHDSGLFYWVKSKMILKENRIWNDNTSAIVINEFFAHDIDTPEDWQLAEQKYKLIYGS
jgi:N-acylneuraminate cytidylyltransferase